MSSTHAIASDLSFLVLQKRRRAGELTTPELNEANRSQHPETGSLKVIRRLRDLDEAEPELGVEGLRLKHGR